LKETRIPFCSSLYGGVERGCRAWPW